MRRRWFHGERMRRARDARRRIGINDCRCCGTYMINHEKSKVDPSGVGDASGFSGQEECHAVGSSSH